MRFAVIGKGSPAEDFGRARDSFLFECEAKGLSPHTIVFYRRYLDCLGEFLNRAGVSAPSCVTRELLRTYVEEVRQRPTFGGRDRSDGGRPVAPRTVNCHTVTVKAFFRYLTREGYLPADAAEGLTQMRQPQKVIGAFTQQQVRALLAQPNRTTFAGLRDHAVMLLLLDTGLRLNEAVSLTLADVDWSQSVVTVRHPKGGRQRQVPLGRAAKRALWRYLDRRGEVPGQDLIFVTQTGDSLSPKTVQKAIQEYGRRAGIEGVRCSPHTFRHTFATWWLRNGGDVFTLQRILGHSSLEMVKRYLSLSTEDLQAAHRRWSPGDALR